MFKTLSMCLMMAIFSIQSMIAAADDVRLRPMSLDIVSMERSRVLKAADAALLLQPITITRKSSPLSRGTANDFYSNGDYWWPNPHTADGLPYVRRDGESNPDNFNDHRLAIRDLRDAVAALAAASKITSKPAYAEKAVALLEVFFVNPATRMNPHLSYAQAIPGVSEGRGIGIIDTLHLIEIPLAIEALKGFGLLPGASEVALKAWFKSYLDWMVTSSNGREEAQEKNNHAVAYWLQVAVFARFANDQSRVTEARHQFTEQFLGKQMAVDGSFPEELRRTKPYGYSIFQLENMAALCQILSTPGDDLWHFKLPDGRGIEKALAYMVPYIEDKSQWALKPDVQAWEDLPVRQPALLFGGLALKNPDYLRLWADLPAETGNDEVRRSLAITQPILWRP